MSGPVAIQTRYKGYRFRSRLEARWAVYFDAEGIAWDYEPEGFVLDGSAYLPDFWLPQVSMYAEVKPAQFSPDELRKCRLLAETTGHGVLLLDGMPDLRSYFFLDPAESDIEIRDAVVSSYCDYHTDEGRFYSSTGAEYPHPAAHPHPYLCIDGMINQPSIDAARAARFEHGESPR